MPIRYQIHVDLRLLVTQYSDVVGDEEYVETYRAVMNSDEYQHGFNELADLQQLTEFHITEDGMRTLSALMKSHYAGRLERARTVVIAPSEHFFGISRMYGAYADPETEQVTVFRNTEEAMKALGLAGMSLAELHGEAPGGE